MNPTSHLSSCVPALLVALLASLPAGPLHAQETHPQLGLDGNGNGVSDLYEALYPATANAMADSDGDGFNNQKEAAAGTNPANATDFLKVFTVSNTGESVVASWPSVNGKIYQLQRAAEPGGPWTNDGNVISGTGAMVSATTSPRGLRMFLRVEVSDVDTDADGITDWEELQAGTDRYLFDTDGDGRSDRSYVQSQMGIASTVNVYPVSSWASEAGPRTAQFRITRHGGFMPVVVSFTTAGSAVRGTDYVLSATSVQMPAGVNEALVTVTPLADAQMEIAETVIFNVAAGSGYQIGNSSSATISIVGQGLTGQYFNTSNTTYSNSANFDPAQLALTRRDPAVDFNWSKPSGTPPGTGTGTPDPVITDDDQWTVRWTGFLYPKTSEVYQIHAIADRGVVVWVSPTPITAAPGATTGARINQWTTTDPTTKYSAGMLSGAAPVVAGQPLYFRVDYRDTGGFTDNAGIQIRWSAPGVQEEAIPSSAFSTEAFPGGAPVITSPLAAAGIRNAPFTFQISATNSPTAFSVSGLPSGLSVNAAGLITGTTNAAEGYYPLTVAAANASGSGSKMIVLYLTSTGGSATREVWNGVSGTGLTAIPLHTAPSSSGTLTSLESPDNSGDNYGERIRGWITAPSTGLYTFFLTSDENAELWVSSSEEPANRLKRSWVAGGSVADGVWDAQPGQKSLKMRMTAGRRYYFEAIRRETTGGDHLAVAWLKPGQTELLDSEVIPSWALSSWSPLADADSSGTLYAAGLSAVAGTSTLGGGSALLLVNEARTEARLSWTFSNLSGAVTGALVQDSRTIQGQAGRTLFDLGASTPDAYGNHTWTFTATLSHSVADVQAAVEGGFAYLSVRTAGYPSGEIRGTFAPVTGSQFFVPPAAPPAAELTIPSDPATARREIVRFLQQATFGARPDTDGVAPWDADSIEAVQQLGYAGWINAQLAMPAGPNPETVRPILMPPSSVAANPTTSTPNPNAPVNLIYGSGPMNSWISDYYLRYPLSAVENGASQSADEIWRAWWALNVKSREQLRHRMAFALSQIIVASEEGPLDDSTRAVTHYYDLLYYHGLGNFRTLLERVTLSPAMGVYLDMLGNKKPNPTTGYIPNENYAREILQLFSVGLMRIHPDGSAVFGMNGLPVDTYLQDNVVGFAHTFTGWNYPAGSGDRISPMAPRPTDHAIGEKLLLEETVLPALAPATVDSCHAELTAALDVIFHHPNTGPFISRQLIQRLVTANPSPGYIYRVASIFDNDGTGVRGNLAAVARAILLDPEARNQQPRSQPGFGHLKEPVIRATQILRAFNGFSYAEQNFDSTLDLGTALCATQSNVDLTQPLPTTNFTINSVVTPYAVVDGYSLAPGNNILVMNQTNAAENGLYTFTGVASPLARATIADSAAEINQAWIRVIAGTNENDYFRQTAVVTTVGTDPQTWAPQTSGNSRRRMWGMGVTTNLTQTPLKSPSVFNFYEPNYVFLGNTGTNGLYAPEFQITTETTVINTANWFYDLTRYNDANAASSSSYGQGFDFGSPIRRDIKLDLAYERGIAADSGALVDHIGALIMPGMMDPRLRTLLVNYLETLPEATDSNRMRRIGEAFYLISLTPEFTWQK
jgi:hypothetical protein